MVIFSIFPFLAKLSTIWSLFSLNCTDFVQFHDLLKKTFQNYVCSISWFIKKNFSKLCYNFLRGGGVRIFLSQFLMYNFFWFLVDKFLSLSVWAAVCHPVMHDNANLKCHNYWITNFALLALSMWKFDLIIINNNNNKNYWTRST